MIEPEKSKNRNVPADSIAVSIGEPAGIGPDIILEAWSQRKSLDIPHFTVLGSAQILMTRSKQLQLDIPVSTVVNGLEAKNCQDMLPVIATGNPMSCVSGHPSDANSAGVIEAIELGVKLVISGEFSALTTCPINKKSLYDCGFKFPGHTEFLASLSTVHTGKSTFPVMMLAGPELRSVPVTIHIALNEVKKRLNLDLIVKTARITANELRYKFGITDPVLAIAGVNPHAGEEGTMGLEEVEIIRPAVEVLRNEGINALGPLPADTMFHERARKTYDVAICMYHDQALIPAKTLGFDDAVNVTLGLPFIRTSPDHGTAFNLAGSRNAKPDSFIAALNLADKMARTRDRSK